MALPVYNKIFTKILDSSIWLESNPTRIVWFTFLAAMDEQGFAQFASVANLAHRARVTLEEAQTAVDCLSSPDENSSDPANEGRRIERVNGGWIVLNCEKYRELVTRAVAQEKTRERVARFRERKRGNGDVTPANETVTPSEALAGAESESETSPPPGGTDGRHREIASRWGALYETEFGVGYSFSGRDASDLKRFLSTMKCSPEEFFNVAACAWRRAKEDRYAGNCKRAATIHGLCASYNDIQVELQSPASGRKNGAGWNQ
jgi:hypothetical protein